MKKQIIGLLALLANSVLGQDVKVTDRSAFTHNYVVSELEYIEETRDTSKFHYIATLQITANYAHKISVANLYQKIESKAVELGANLFFLESFKVKDSIGNFSIKIYFAGNPLKKENRLKEKKGCIYLFDFYSKPDQMSVFFLDNKAVSFAPGSFLIIKIAPGDSCSISLTSKPKYFTLNTDNQSRFIFLNSNPYRLYKKLDPAQVGYKTTSFHAHENNYLKPTEISTTELKYVLGRLLLEMYSLAGAEK